METHQHQTTQIGAMLLGAVMCLVPLRAIADGTVTVDEPTLERGVLLIASESLLDPRFARSVILITDHGKEGAVGVMLNRPTMVRVVDAIPVLAEHLNKPEKIMYFGGPVAANSASVLVSARQPIEGATRIIDGVYAVYRMSDLLEHFADETFAPRTRFYGGYAGWGPGQLEAEIRRSDWTVIDADPNTVFSKEVENLWKELKGQFSGLWALLTATEAALRLDVARAILGQAPRTAHVCDGRHDSATTLVYRNLTVI